MPRHNIWSAKEGYDENNVLGRRKGAQGQRYPYMERQLPYMETSKSTYTNRIE